MTEDERLLGWSWEESEELREGPLLTSSLVDPESAPPPEWMLEAVRDEWGEVEGR